MDVGFPLAFSIRFPDLIASESTSSSILLVLDPSEFTIFLNSFSTSLRKKMEVSENWFSSNRHSLMKR